MLDGTKSVLEEDTRVDSTTQSDSPGSSNKVSPGQVLWQKTVRKIEEQSTSEKKLSPAQILWQKTRQRLEEVERGKSARSSTHSSVAPSVVPAASSSPTQNAIVAVPSRERPASAAQAVVPRGAQRRKINPAKIIIQGSFVATGMYFMPNLTRKFIFTQSLSIPGWLTSKILPKMPISQAMIDSLCHMYFVPGHFGSQLSGKMIQSFLKGAYDGPAPKAINFICSGLIIYCSLYGVGPANIAAAYIPELTNTYGPITYLIGPATVLLAEKGPQLIPACGKATAKTLSGINKGLEVSRDVFDLVHGMGEENTQDMPEDFVTHALGCVASGIGSSLSWLWSKAKQTPSAMAQVQETLEDAGVPLKLG
jgi:hypothetical protein